MKSIKQIGRKIAPYAVAGLMSLPGYARANDSLPVYQETRQEVAELRQEQDNAVKEELAQLVGKYSESLKYARDQFNRTIKDGEFSISEQDSVYTSYRNAESLVEKVKQFAMDKGIKEYSNFKMDEADSKIYHYLYKNTAGLEKELQKNGMNVNVEVKEEFNYPLLVAIFTFFNVLLGRGRRE